VYFAGPPIWLLLAPVYLLIVVIVAVIWATIRFRARKRSKDLPTCRRCEYVVIGLDRGVCPECGSYLTRAHAIVRPDTVGTRTATRRLIIFTLLMSYPAVVVGVVLAELAIWPNLCAANVHASFAQPASRVYDIALLHIVNDGELGKHRPARATLQFDRGPQTSGERQRIAVVHIDLPHMMWRSDPLVSTHPRVDQPVDAATLASFMAERFNSDPATLADEARCLLSALHTLATASSQATSRGTAPTPPALPGPFTQINYGTVMIYCENPWWVNWVIGAATVFVWLIFATFIIIGARRHARRNRLALQHAVASMTPSPIANR